LIVDSLKLVLGVAVDRGRWQVHLRAPCPDCSAAGLRIVKRSDDRDGCVAPPKRWILERTFGWLGQCRGLSKDYESLTARSMALHHLMQHRLRPE